MSHLPIAAGRPGVYKKKPLEVQTPGGGFVRSYRTWWSFKAYSAKWSLSTPYARSSLHASTSESFLVVHPNFDEVVGDMSDLIESQADADLFGDECGEDEWLDLAEEEAGAAGPESVGGSSTPVPACLASLPAWAGASPRR